MDTSTIYKIYVALNGDSFTALAVVSLCSGDDMITMGDVAKKLHYSTPSATGSVDAAEKMGWIERGRLPEDRRAVTVIPTQKGLARLDEVIAAAELK